MITWKSFEVRSSSNKVNHYRRNLTGRGRQNILFGTKLYNPTQLPAQLTYCSAQFASKTTHNFNFSPSPVRRPGLKPKYLFTSSVILRFSWSFCWSSSSISSLLNLAFELSKSNSPSNLTGPLPVLGLEPLVAEPPLRPWVRRLPPCKWKLTPLDKFSRMYHKAENNYWFWFYFWLIKMWRKFYKSITECRMVNHFLHSSKKRFVWY